METYVSLHSKVIITVLNLLLLTLAAAAQAQTGAPLTSSQAGVFYEDKLKGLSELTALGNDLFGDRVSLYTGGIQFTQVDVDLPGNNALPMRFSRTLKMGGRRDTLKSMRDWDFDLPYISGMFGQSGWVSMVPGEPLRRCSIPLSAPQQASAPSEYVRSGQGDVGFSFDPHFFWGGLSLSLPGKDGKPMIIMGAGAKKPVDGRSYHWTTADRWVFSCLPNTSNGESGEAFMAHAPNGDRYWFDRIVAIPRGTMTASYGNGFFNYTSTMGLREFRALPTRIEDRSGNFITFTYSADQVVMNASDGRSITVNSGPDGVASVVANGRTWSYEYSGISVARRLTRVILPDGSGWSFDAGAAFDNPVGGWRNCADFVSFIPGASSSATVIMTHPSGAMGTFEMSYRLHGRTNAPNTCRPFTQIFYPVESHLLTVLALNRKVISGPGLATMTWNYQYTPLAASLDTGQHVYCSTTPCPETRALTVSREDGSWDRFTFSQKYGDLEGQLLSEERGNTQGVLRRIDIQYRRSSDGSYARIGNNPCWSCSKEEELPKPLESRTITQDGNTFLYRVDQFDAYARPLKVTRSSSP